MSIVRDLGPIIITKAYKDVSRYKENQICVTVEAAGIFPGGRRPHVLSFSPGPEETTWITPLYTHIKGDVHLPVSEVKEWFKSLPVQISKTTPVPIEWWPEAAKLAKEVDSYIKILDMPKEMPKEAPPKAVLPPVVVAVTRLAEVLPPPRLTAVDYDRRYSLGELRQMCKDKGLSVSGDKKTLARRLITET